MQENKPQRRLKTSTYTFRLTSEQYVKLINLGGADWIRDQINKAKLKEEKK
jgi:hypothetical protein